MKTSLPEWNGPRPPVLLAIGAVHAVLVLWLAVATARGLDLGAWMDPGPATAAESRAGGGRGWSRWFHK